MSEEKKEDPYDLAAGVPGIQGEMRPKPKFADRISWRVLAVAVGFVGLMLVIFFVALNGVDDKPKPKAGQSAEDKAKAQIVGTEVPRDFKTARVESVATSGASAAPVELEKKQGSLVNPMSWFPHAASAPAAAGKSGIPMVPALGSSGSIPPAGAQPGVSGAALTPEQQAAEQAKEERRSRLQQARASGLSAKSFDGGGGNAPGAAGATTDLLAGLKQMAAGNAQSGGALMPVGMLQKQSGEQDEKMQFLKDSAKEDRNYHPYTPAPALSKNEVKVGTWIPMALESGINSDLPGQIVARTTDAVYDSVSGCRLLIPAMTKVIGRYDSKVAMGQSRMLVVWNAAVFPDGSELNLAGMQGYDMAGQTGLDSDVDNHYWRLFGLAFGMSMVTATVQLSVSQQGAGTNGISGVPTTSQTIANALAQQYGQLGGQILGKYMQVQPTLRDFPGERFNIMVPHTIVFGKVWENRCGPGY